MSNSSPNHLYDEDVLVAWFSSRSHDVSVSRLLNNLGANEESSLNIDILRQFWLALDSFSGSMLDKAHIRANNWKHFRNECRVDQFSKLISYRAYTFSVHLFGIERLLINSFNQNYSFGWLRGLIRSFPSELVHHFGISMMDIFFVFLS